MSITLYIFFKTNLLYDQHKNTFAEFTPELSAAVRRQPDISSMAVLEEEAFSTFVNPDPSRKWLHGIEKCYFNYLLLDPRVTQNLPVRVKVIGMYSF